MTVWMHNQLYIACFCADQLALEVDLSSIGAPLANGHAPVASKPAPPSSKAASQASAKTARGGKAAATRPSQAGGKAQAASKGAKDPAAEMRERQLHQEAAVCAMAIDCFFVTHEHGCWRSSLLRGILTYPAISLDCFCDLHKYVHARSLPSPPITL